MDILSSELRADSLIQNKTYRIVNDKICYTAMFTGIIQQVDYNYFGTESDSMLFTRKNGEIIEISIFQLDKYRFFEINQLPHNERIAIYKKARKMFNLRIGALFEKHNLHNDIGIIVGSFIEL